MLLFLLIPTSSSESPWLRVAGGLTQCLLLQLVGSVLIPVGPVWRLGNDIPSGEANLGKGVCFELVGFSFLET